MIKDKKQLAMSDMRQIKVKYINNVQTYTLFKNDVEDMIKDIIKRNFTNDIYNNLRSLEVSTPIVTTAPHLWSTVVVCSWLTGQDGFNTKTKYGIVYKDAVSYAVSQYNVDKIYHRRDCARGYKCKCIMVPEYMGSYICDYFKHLLTNTDDERVFKEWIDSKTWMQMNPLDS